MSRSVDLFISSTKPVEELATVIAERCGLTPEAPTPGGGAPLTAGPITATLRANDVADGEELRVSRYSHVLSMSTDAAGHLGTTPEVALARAVASALSDHHVLLVLDLQYRSTGAGAPA